MTHPPTHPLIGLTSDANILINQARLAAQRYLFQYQETIPVEQLVRAICDFKQVGGWVGGWVGGVYMPLCVFVSCVLYTSVSLSRFLPVCLLTVYSSNPPTHPPTHPIQSYTQFGGLRPFGVSFLFAGYDRHHGFQLYESDPAGKLIHPPTHPPTQPPRSNSTLSSFLLYPPTCHSNRLGLNHPPTHPPTQSKTRHVWWVDSYCYRC